MFDLGKKRRRKTRGRDDKHKTMVKNLGPARKEENASGSGIEVV